MINGLIGAGMLLAVAIGLYIYAGVVSNGDSEDDN